MQVAILDRGRDKAAQAATDEPGQCSSEPGRTEPFSRHWSTVAAVPRPAVGIHPLHEQMEIFRDRVGGLRAVPVAAGHQDGDREQLRRIVELLENGDRTRDRLDDDPRILPQLSFGDLDSVEVGGALPFPAGELPQSGARMTTDAAAFEGQGTSPGLAPDKYASTTKQAVCRARTNCGTWS